MLLDLDCLFDHAGTSHGNAKLASNFMQAGSRGDGAGDGMMSMEDLRHHAQDAPQKLQYGKDWNYWSIIVSGFWLQLCECMAEEERPVPTWEQVTTCVGCMLALHMGSVVWLRKLFC